MTSKSKNHGSGKLQGSLCGLSHVRHTRSLTKLKLLLRFISQTELVSGQFDARRVTGGPFNCQTSWKPCTSIGPITTLFMSHLFSLHPHFLDLECQLIVAYDQRPTPSKRQPNVQWYVNCKSSTGSLQPADTTADQVLTTVLLNKHTHLITLPLIEHLAVCGLQVPTSNPHDNVYLPTDGVTWSQVSH